MPYKQAKVLTRGAGHAIEAHHLIPNRYLGRKWFNGPTTDIVPAVILPYDDHLVIEAAIRTAEAALGKPNSMRGARDVLRRAYKDFPAYYQAIRGYF